MLLALSLGVAALHLAVSKLVSKDRFAFKCSKYAFDVFFFAVAVRLMILSYLFVLLCVISEITITNDIAKYSESYLAAFVMLILLLLIFVGVVYQWGKSSNSNFNQRTVRASETFRGLKDTRKARFQAVLVMVKICIFVVVP